MTLDVVERPERIVVYPIRWHAIALVLFSAFVLWFAIWAGSERILASWQVFLLVYICVPLFGGLGIYMAYHLIARRPHLVIDSTGITDSYTPFGAGHMSWDEVDRFVLVRSKNGLALAMVPKDGEAFWSRRGDVARFLAKLSHPMGHPPVMIPQGSLEMPLRELADLLHSRYGVRVEELTVAPPT